MPAGCILAIGYFAYHTFQGEQGLRAYSVYDSQIRELAVTAQKVRAQRETLEHRVALLSPQHVDPDYADELVRRHLGLAHPDEDVIMLEPRR